jgi:hypothetical protein
VCIPNSLILHRHQHFLFTPAMLLAGLAMLDLFGGIGSMLLSVMQAGFIVTHYFYCDHCTLAAAVVRNNIGPSPPLPCAVRMPFLVFVLVYSFN